MDIRRKEKGKEHKKRYGPGCIRKKEDIKGNVMLQSLCVVMSVNIA